MKWSKRPGFCSHCHCAEFFLSDYEEDFEVDEEKQDERAEDEGQAEDQMSATSKSPTEGEKDNLSLEKEEAPDVHDSDNREDDGCSDSEEEDRQGRWQSVSQCACNLSVQNVE